MPAETKVPSSFVTLLKKLNLMETNWFVIGAVTVCAIVLLIFLIKRNLKDEKELEAFLNKNEHPGKKEEAELNNSEQP